MTTLVIPSFEQRLLRTISEEVAAKPIQEWPKGSLHLSLDILRSIRENTTQERQQLEKVLAGGVEARRFARDYSPLLPGVEDQIAEVRELVQRLSTAEDPASKNSLGELRLLEQEIQSYRDLLAEALARASRAPRPVDWERVRAAEEAHARGETKPFSRR